MKNIIIITILFFALLSCKAQNPIVSIDARYKTTQTGGYFKDLNNELNKFVGTWDFTNSNNSFTIILQKKEMVYDGDEYYEDILVGEYKYIENGVEIVNTMPTIALNPNDNENRNIGGRYIIPNDLYVVCDDCSANERRIMLYFNDPERPYLSVSIILRHIQEAGEFGQSAQMTATIFSNGGVIIPNENSPTETRVPYGEYLMIKQ